MKKRTQSVSLLLLIFVILVSGTSIRADQAVSPGLVSFNGYFKSFITVFSFTDKQAGWFDLRPNALGSVNNRLRLKFGVSPTANLRIDAAYELVATIQDPDLYGLDPFGFNMNPGGYRIKDFRSRIYPKPSVIMGSFGLFHNLDRFSLTWKLPAADITVGRQVLAWGSARIINPTDILIPFSFNELDKEERTGVDAVRIRIPLGAMSELDAGLVPGPNFHLSEGAAYLKSRLVLWNTDVSLLLMDFRKHLLVGLDLARSVGGASVWLESAYVFTGAFGKSEELPERDYFSLSAGADHQLGGKTYAFIEYHFNGAGKRKDLEYADSLGESAYLDGAVYLLGRHYLGGGLNYQATPLLPVTGFLVWNMNDGSVIAVASGEYNIAENVYLAAGAHVGLGGDPEIISGLPPYPGLGINSEFGLYPDLFFASFRIYF